MHRQAKNARKPTSAWYSRSPQRRQIADGNAKPHLKQTETKIKLIIYQNIWAELSRSDLSPENGHAECMQMPLPYTTRKWFRCVFIPFKSIPNDYYCGIIYAKPPFKCLTNAPNNWKYSYFHLICLIKKQFDCNLTYRLRCSTHESPSHCHTFNRWFLGLSVRAGPSRLGWWF